MAVKTIAREREDAEHGPHGAAGADRHGTSEDPLRARLRRPPEILAVETGSVRRVDPAHQIPLGRGQGLRPQRW